MLKENRNKYLMFLTVLFAVLFWSESFYGNYTSENTDDKKCNKNLAKPHVGTVYPRCSVRSYFAKEKTAMFPCKFARLQVSFFNNQTITTPMEKNNTQKAKGKSQTKISIELTNAQQAAVEEFHSFYRLSLSESTKALLLWLLTFEDEVALCHLAECNRLRDKNSCDAWEEFIKNNKKKENITVSYERK